MEDWTALKAIRWLYSQHRANQVWEEVNRHVYMDVYVCMHTSVHAPINTREGNCKKCWMWRFEAWWWGLTSFRLTRQHFANLHLNNNAALAWPAIVLHYVTSCARFFPPLPSVIAFVLCIYLQPLSIQSYNASTPKSESKTWTRLPGVGVFAHLLARSLVFALGPTWQALGWKMSSSDGTLMKGKSQGELGSAHWLASHPVVGWCLILF